MQFHHRDSGSSLKSAARDGRFLIFAIKDDRISFAKSAAMDGRFLTYAIKYDRIG